ncbi:MAG TPA: DUF255 domain-containing protein [Chitinophagaceae bacterium]|nr:DUF255 domain-containing protein [Chitinophagaceae bacterium]HNF71492.1 DUF255 domain-containing protein [Chitinophagaceae bacterium]
MNRMKSLLILGLLLTGFCSCAQKNKSTGIHWMTIEAVQEEMKLHPKKVYIDLYTDWCGWCKVMDKKTFTHPKVIEYMNEHFYAIHMNAETADSFFFQGKKYGRIPGTNTNELAANFMHQKMTFPTSVFCDEGFANPNPVPGYLDVPTMELILKYIGGNKHKQLPFDEYKASFKAEWN